MLEFKLIMFQNRLILRQFQALVDQPESDWTVEFYYPNDLKKWKIYLNGPSETPYENGKFQLSVIFPETYPFKPPKFRFNTQIFHPNIDFDGHLSIGILNQLGTYNPAVSIRSVMREIISVLEDPDPKYSLCPEAAYLFSRDQRFFREKATSWTITYATNDEIISSSSISPQIIENVCSNSYKRKSKFAIFNFFKDFSPPESVKDSSRSSSLNRSNWLFKPCPVGTEAHYDQWETYSKADQRFLEHAYQRGQSLIELHENFISFNEGLQVSNNYEAYIVKRVILKLKSRRRKYRSLAFSRGESVQPIPIIDQCLSSSVNTSISALIEGIQREGLLQKKQSEAKEAIEILKKIPENDTDLIGLRCVYLYTRNSFIHQMLNKFLRDQDFNKISTLGPLCKLIYSQFSKYRLKPNEAESLIVYRGATFNSAELRAFKRGTGKTSFYWLEFVSTSKSLKVAKLFVGNVLLVIRLNKLYGDGRAMQIQKVSEFEEEEEVLLRPGVEFSIKTWVCDDEVNKKYTFHLDAYI